jgi:hypothetical protein
LTAPVTSNIANPGNFLRSSRNFPTDSQALSVEISKTYIDIANQVNHRISSIYGTSPTITGEAWFLTGLAGRQNSLRRVFRFTSTGSIPHGILWVSVSQISPKSYGSFTDGTNWYGAIYASSVAIAGQVSFYVTPTNIVIISGAGAPAITNGTIILEWISQP